MIDENLGGKADRKRIQKTKCINALYRISELLKAHYKMIAGNERVIRLLAQACKVVGEEKQDDALLVRAA
jgi:hypothetical protein